eukprot:s1510_g7.t1
MTPVPQGKSADDFPKGNNKTVYVKELFFKTRNKDSFEAVIRDFKEVQKLSKNRDTEFEIKAQHSEQASKAEQLKELRGGPCIRDVSMRPSMGSARSRPVWNLEAHQNGFRCGVRGSATEKLEILYSQINVAIFQPCERRSLMVLIHFHLKEPIMVSRRKTERCVGMGRMFGSPKLWETKGRFALRIRRTFEIQFYTEVRAQTEENDGSGDLSMRRSANAYDPDEILEEQREEEMKVRLNKVFQDFVVKTQKLPGFKLKFELPTEEPRLRNLWSDLADALLVGVPPGQQPNLPVSKAFKVYTKGVPLVSAFSFREEWPPLVVDMDSVEIAVFERVTPATREFDMVLIYKDYSQTPTPISMIPAERMVDLKTFFGDIKMTLGSPGLSVNNFPLRVWYLLPINMQWKAVMQEITGDIAKFVENGGFQPWFDTEEDSDDDDAAKDPNSEPFSTEHRRVAAVWNEPSEESEDDDDDDDDDDDSEFEDEEDEEGKSWDELEREAEEEDRRQQKGSKAKAKEITSVLWAEHSSRGAC